MEVVLEMVLFLTVLHKSMHLVYSASALSFSSSSLPPELQAAFCIHSDTAPIAKHSKGLLEIGAGLPLHIHSNAQ